MKIVENIKRLNSISAYQKGFFSAAQAKKLGVERYTLSRLEKANVIERLSKGVYRMGGAPSLREEEVFAAWLSLNSMRNPGLESSLDAPVATGVTAAWLHELGEIGPTPLKFCVNKRKQTQREGLTIRVRQLNKEDITYPFGIPATSPSKTICDLIVEGEDLSLVSNVLNDALRRNLIKNEEALAVKINNQAEKIGFPKKTDLYTQMKGGAKS